MLSWIKVGAKFKDEDDDNIYTIIDISQCEPNEDNCTNCPGSLTVSWGVDGRIIENYCPQNEDDDGCLYMSISPAPTVTRQKRLSRMV